MKENFIHEIEKTIKAVRSYPSKEVLLYHHNDTDGLCAGAILLKAFSDSGYNVSRFSLEKPYPQVLERIFLTSGQIIVFTDFAGKIAPLISVINNGRNLVLIIDHHPAEAVDDPSVYNIDGDLFGLKGDRDISASATCYLFADAFLKQSGQNASGLSHLGTLGAVGDGFLVDGALSGVNRDVLNTAVQNNLIRMVKHDLNEEYFVLLGGEEYPAADLCKYLDTAGGVGYYYNGTSLGVDICLNGLNPEIFSKIETFEQQKDEVFNKEIENIKRNILTTEHLQWFNVENRFRPMGVKMIGVFCNLIKDMDFLEKDKYLAGFQIVPDEVPGFGEVMFNSSKISMRVSEELTKKIRADKAPGLSSFLPAATKQIGGFADACHSLSAATTVKIGQEQALIDEIEKELQLRIK